MGMHTYIKHATNLSLSLSLYIQTHAKHAPNTYYKGSHIYNRDAYLCTKYSKASLNRSTMGPTLNGPFRKVIGLES